MNDNDPKVLASIEWQCLPAGSFYILGDAWTQSAGISTNIAIDYCKNLATKPNVGFDGTNC